MEEERQKFVLRFYVATRYTAQNIFKKLMYDILKSSVRVRHYHRNTLFAFVFSYHATPIWLCIVITTVVGYNNVMMVSYSSEI